MNKKEIAKIKAYIAKSNRDFGFVKPDTGEVSPHTKIRIARKGSAIYEFYKQNNLYGKEPTSPVLYWGSKDMDAGNIVDMEKFAKLQKWANKQVNKPGAILVGSKKDTEHLIMRSTMRNYDSIKETGWHNNLRVASVNSYRRVVAGKLAKAEYQGEFVRQDPKATYKMLDSIIDNLGDGLSKTDWWKMTLNEKQAWMASQAVGTRKTGTLYFYGDSI